MRFTALHRFSLGSVLCMAVFATSGAERCHAQSVTADQKARISELAAMSEKAAQSFKEGQLVACAEVVEKMRGEMIALAAGRKPAVMRAIKPIYARLKRAYGLLEIEGAELELLPAWKDLGMEAGDASGGTNDMDAAVSFTRDLAPWFVSACGNCHVDNSRGQFSMASFDALSRGARGARVFYPGDVKGSRLVEVIESGDMPRGNRKVTPEQLNMLKRWIAEGAKFDGESPATRLTSFRNDSPAVENKATPSAVAMKPKGNETLSFAKDVAPILVENCNGCHIAGRRASGNFRMDSFAQLLRGGDSGEPIAGTNANASLLIRKLKGQSGQRMPAGGRPPLSDEEISLISTWIREGATFDGGSDRLDIESVIAQGWAADASHEELFAWRKDRANAAWSRVLPNENPEESVGSEVVVLGNVSKDRVRDLSGRLEAAIALTKKSLRAPDDQPLVKGGLASYLLKNRYDYSEFGRMTEGRELPKEWNSHWNAETLDVYTVFISDAEVEEKQRDARALKAVAGAYVGSFTGVPFWFAEGVARNLVITNYRRGAPEIATWQAALPAAMQKVSTPKSLLDNRLDEESAGLAGMALTNFMMNKSNRRRFDRMMQLMRDGRTFEEAMTFAFAPPEVVVKAWLGKK